MGKSPPSKINNTIPRFQRWCLDVLDFFHYDVQQKELTKVRSTTLYFVLGVCGAVCGLSLLSIGAANIASFFIHLLNMFYRAAILFLQAYNYEVNKEGKTNPQTTSTKPDHSPHILQLIIMVSILFVFAMMVILYSLGVSGYDQNTIYYTFVTICIILSTFLNCLAAVVTVFNATT